MAKSTFPFRHVGYIVDGNGRWAESKGLPRKFGHAQGASVCQEIVRETFQMGVETVTLYLFSTENWQRPDEEIANIFSLLEKYLKEFNDYLQTNRIVVKTLGQMYRLPVHVQELLGSVGHTHDVKVSDQQEVRTLCLAVSYGGRDDILEACKSLIKDGASLEDVTEANFSRLLSTGKQNIPDTDLIIRTSGELRLSNFFLWQAAYTEFSSVDVFWPDFTAERAREVILNASQRKRRFGKSQ
jgi:undecaprenyl diphosphate synthase